MSTAPPEPGRCIACDYSLRGLDRPRCPECGRPFDPDDPRTMNMGRALGGVGRWMVRPVGWALVLAMLAAVGALLSVTRPPVGEWVPCFSELLYPWRTGDWRGRWDRMHDFERIAAVAVPAVLVLVCLWAAGFVIRLVSTLAYRQNLRVLRRGWKREVLCMLLLVAGLWAVESAWPYRVARAVVHEEVLDPPLYPNRPAVAAVPKGRWVTGQFTAEQRRAIFRAGLRYLPSAQERAAMMVMAWDQQTADCPQLLNEAAMGEKAGDLQVAYLRALGCARRPYPAAAMLLESPHEAVRIAAADAVALTRWRTPRFSIFGSPSSAGIPVLSGDARLWFDPAKGTSIPRGEGARHETEPAETKDRLTRMLASVSAAERDAAARAVTTGMGEDEVRVVEWCVWTTLDLVPPLRPGELFIHAPPPREPVAISVLQAASSRTAAVQVFPRIYAGWDTTGVHPPLNGASMTIPWMRGVASDGNCDHLLMVLRPAGVPVPVPATNRISRAPWDGLRNVPCSWMQVGDRTERYVSWRIGRPQLPVAVEQTHHRIRISASGAQGRFGDDSMPPRMQGRRLYAERAGLLVSVQKGKVRGMSMPMDEAFVMRIPPPDWPREDEMVAERFRAMLNEAGMNDAEIDAFLAIWGRSLLDREGTRLLLIPSAADMDASLPVRIVPAPASRIRVGVMCIEIDTQRSITQKLE